MVKLNEVSEMIIERLRQNTSIKMTVTGGEA
jgi:hypothetical protein